MVTLMDMFENVHKTVSTVVLIFLNLASDPCPPKKKTKTLNYPSIHSYMLIQSKVGVSGSYFLIVENL